MEGKERQKRRVEVSEVKVRRDVRMAATALFGEVLEVSVDPMDPIDVMIR